MSIKIGTRMSSHNRQFEVVSILANGGLRLRPTQGTKHDGTRYELGEQVRIVGVDLDGDLAGEVVSLSPIRAKVTSGVFGGLEVGGDKIRKGK
jgi:hypothetical protein